MYGYINVVHWCVRLCYMIVLFRIVLSCDCKVESCTVSLCDCEV